MDKPTIRKTTLFKIAIVESAHEIMSYTPPPRCQWSTNDICKEFNSLINHKIDLLSKFFIIIPDN